MKTKALVSALAIAGLAVSPASGDVILTGILDGDLSGGDPKAIELYVSGTEDLADFDLERAANDAIFDFSIGLSGTFTDEFVYIVNTSDLDDFEAIFGTTGDFANVITSTSITGNGNDAFRIVEGTTVIDQISTGGVVEYADGFLYRVDGTGPDGGFVIGNFTSGSVDGLDITEYAATVPFGTYAIPEPASLGLLAAGGLLLAGRRRRNG
ncbi:MAG: PEP-CTERM sorting domain-containing protein [Planctomycetota bacterium]